MIIEGAFHKLPELLLGHDSPEGQYEATLASHLAMAVLLELSARNVPMPQRRIHVERPYPVEKVGPAARSDLFVDLDGVFPPEPCLSYYGFHTHNVPWSIEQVARQRRFAERTLELMGNSADSA